MSLKPVPEVSNQNKPSPHGIVTRPENLTVAEKLRVLKSNFNFLVMNYLGLVNNGYKDGTTGEFRFVVDKIYLINTEGSNWKMDENCPIERALAKIATSTVLSNEQLEHAKILGESSAHVWNRAQKIKRERKEVDGERESMFDEGEIGFTHSYISTVLSTFPLHNGNQEEATIMDIFDSTLNNLQTKGRESTLYLLSVKDGIARIVTSLPESLQEKLSAIARSK